MGRLDSLTGNELIKALKTIGFVHLRTRGSHHFLAHTDGRVTVVPVHKGETIGSGLLSKILRDTKLTKPDLIKIL